MGLKLVLLAPLINSFVLLILTISKFARASRLLTLAGPFFEYSLQFPFSLIYHISHVLLLKSWKWPTFLKLQHGKFLSN